MLVLLFLPAHVVFADTGPKPTMDFEFKQGIPGGAVTIVSGILYECERSDCSDAAPLQALGPQRLTCDALSCNALAYGFSRYHRLEIQFSDGKTRQSNIFKTAGFDSRYLVTINQDDLTVEAQFTLGVLPPTLMFLIACICCVLSLVLITGLIIYLVWRSRKK
jgi:hypothetical protein